MDDMLEKKGIPRGTTIFLAGGPGSGKTTLAIQFLVNGAVSNGESGLYVVADETPYRLRTNMMRFGFDIEKLEEAGKLMILDIAPIRYLPREEITIGIGKKFSIKELREKIEESIQKVGGKRVVIDPITVLGFQYTDEVERRYAMIDLLESLSIMRTTNILVSELKGTGLEREHMFEEYLAQGVILLRNIRIKGRLVRSLQVEKMRGLEIDTQPRPYSISSKGIEVYPEETIL